MATDEASVWPAWKAAICAATEADTIQTRITNLVARPTWAPVAPGRVLRTRAVMSWVGREEELAALSPTQREEIAAQWAQARQDGRAQDTEVIAGQDCGIIREVLPAAAVVREMITTAETILRRFADPR